MEKIFLQSGRSDLSIESNSTLFGLNKEKSNIELEREFTD